MPAGTQTKVVSAENAFGFALLRATMHGGNVFISPFSVGQALGVVYLGARGDTAQAFVKSSVVPSVDSADYACASQNLRADLPQSDADVMLQFANALWLRQGLTLKSGFVQSAHDAFGADVSALDFASPDALRTINGWVSQQTKGHIPTILDSLGNAEAIITNAVYFKGAWAKVFSASQTAPEHFAGSTGVTTVPFMRQTGTMSYYAGSGYQLVRLGYADDRFAMYVVLPARGGGLTMAGSLAQTFADALAHATPRRVELHLPKMHLAYDVNLVSPLSSLGLGVAFSDRANFSGISDLPMKITGVIHKTTLDVDEKGTTATAATAVVMEATAIYEPPKPPVVVKVDHPFFCIIRDDSSGALLFLGAIANLNS
jgi:serine protease inhibitor